MNKVPLLMLAMLLATCCLAKTLTAQNAPPPKRQYKVDYQVLLPNGNGDAVPIRVRITPVPAIPLTSDQYFHVTMHNGYLDAAEAYSTSAELTIPAGKTSADVELLFRGSPTYYRVLLVEQGKTHTQNIGNDLFHQQFEAVQLNHPSHSWLLISSNAPKEPCNQSQTVSRPNGTARRMGGTRSMPSIFSEANFNGAFSGDKQIPGLKKIFGANLSSVLNRDHWHALQPNELPQTWVGLSSVGRILISHDEFKTVTQVPAFRKLLEQWVAAGGYLFVFNSGNSLSHADSVFPLLQGKEQTAANQRWKPLNLLKGNYRSLPRKQWKANHLDTSELTAKTLMASSPYANGRVIVMVAPEKLSHLTESSFPYPDTISNQSFRKKRNERHSPIPGVGKPPIALFGVFTSLFLFLIGPVILVIVTLNNDRRFLFFLVPVFSFLTCISILGYAIVADFNKQLGRTETITVLDSRSGVAFTRASSAYYCGSQPPYYAYDTDTLIQTTTNQDSGYRIRQLPEENRLSSPRIQPRKIHEVFTAKPYLTQQRFRVTDSAKQPGTPEVTNLLGSRINQAAFEFQGKFYWVQDVAPKQTVLSIETNPAECRKRLRQTTSDQLTHDGVPFAGGSPLFNASSSWINSAISKLTSSSPEPREFTAIIDANPAIEPLIEPFDYKLQLHVVHGKHN